MKIGFDTKKYLKLQKKAVAERIKKFGSKLYLEFGGKLSDDMHAARVLPGYEADVKLQWVLEFKKECEVIVAVNANDIDDNKVRKDNNLTYSEEVQKIINLYTSYGIKVAGVAITRYFDSKTIKEFTRLINHLGVKVYKHYTIAGYPKDLPLILSKEGLGKNEFIETTKPLVIVTAPGPNSGKMATCLSQLYHSSQKGIKAGYAKFETFPVWNLPLKDPINLAYEAATLELDDVNMIDPFHLQHYKKMAINYNRDIDSFPLLKAIFEQLYGKSPYYSPTDMGVNQLGFAITNKKVCERAAKNEIIRRHYGALKDVFLGKYEDKIVKRSEWLMNQVGVNALDRACVNVCLEKHAKTKRHTVAIEIAKDKIVVGKETKDLSASSAALINALKALGKIDDKIYLIQPVVLESIQKLQKETTGKLSRLNIAETVVCLALQSITNPLAAIACKQLPLVKGMQAHASCILKEAERAMFKKIGIDITETAASYIKLPTIK